MSTPDHIVFAEELGYEYAFTYDSPTFLADPWITLSRAAERTSRIKIGPSVITPELRHLVANASAIATLHTLAPGRVEVVVGSGFTSQAMLGRGPVSWGSVERYVVALRSILGGEDIEWEGTMVGLRYGPLSGVNFPIEIPFRVAAHGPKGYAVAERSADGMVTNLGHHTANTGETALDHAMLLFYGTVLDEGEPLGSERVVDATGPAAAFQLHIGNEGIAPDAPEAIAYQKHLAAVPTGSRHLEIHRGHLIEVTEAERPLITPKLIKNATGSGTRSEIHSALRKIESSGAEGVLYGPMGHDINRELERFAECAGLLSSHPGSRRFESV